jgi:hypothetical protein
MRWSHLPLVFPITVAWFFLSPLRAGEFQSKVAPFLQQYCIECHGPMNAEAEFRVDRSLPNTFDDVSVRGKWSEVVNVLNSHEMPPEDSRQPSADEVASIVDWITEQLVDAERKTRSNQVVMRRLNRNEYKNTIRDLTGVDFDVSGFPLDPAAGGFDNVGSALTFSPMQMELYLDAAQKILNEALLTGEKPSVIKWRFEIDAGDSDSYRVKTGKHNPIVNGGNNPVVNGFKKVQFDRWDKKLNVRDFAVDDSGKYIVRFRAATRIPNRKEVVDASEKKLQDRLEKQMKENPKGKPWHDHQYEADLAHFQTDRMYDYGPVRAKVVLELGGQPKTVGEMDIPATIDEPGIFEVVVDMSTQKAGITIEYAYSVPSVVENFWLQRSEAFARPELYVDWIELEGPIHPQWPSASRTTLLPDPLTVETEDKNIESLIGRFARRAFRRPITRADVAPYIAIYKASRESGLPPEESFKNALSAILVSPHFLFLVENQVANQNDATRISDHELASRLSYFLWSSMPDAELMEAANKRLLRDPQVLRQQAERMIKQKDRTESLVENVADQWLGLREIGANPPAIDLYPHYDRHLETSMLEESRGFFRTVLYDDRNVLDFVDSDYVYINERLARFYGIEGVRGDEHRVVPVMPSHHRGGVMTQASMLTITSNGTRTSPVKRGTWVLKNVLGTDPGLPVANAGDIAPSVPGIDKATVRQRLEIHRELPQCARCHNKIDPLGLALENYNASGEYRIQEGFGYKGRIDKNDPKIDASSKLPNGTKIDGPEELKRELRKDESRFLSCLTEKVLVYALGRELTVADRPTVKKIVEKVKANRYELDELIFAVIESEPFQRY